jgi:membrane protease subunit (stomatin/prohibitin family)
MGLWDSIKSHAGAQFLDVIQWLDDTRDTIVFRFPTFQQVIQDGGKLVVREGQVALFVQEGVLSPVFGPGTHELSTRSPAIAGFFQGIKYGFEGPYKGEVYFINTRVFTAQRWGTATPIPMRDKDFGIVRIRANGAFAFRITAPEVFFKEVVSTSGLVETEDITGQLKRTMLATLADTLGESKIPLLDLVAQYVDLGDALRERINPKFSAQYGITITDFAIEGITVPEDVEKAIDRRASMGATGDLAAFTQYQAASALGNAGAHGVGGTMMDAGLGLAMGQVVGQALGRSGVGAAAPAVPPPVEVRYHYNGPGAPQGEYTATQVAGFIAGHRAGNHQVWAAGWPSWQAASAVAEIARLVPPAPSAPPPLPGGPVFHYNGPSGDVQASAADVAASVKAHPGARHLVWRDGMPAWAEAASVPEIAALLGGAPPPLPPAGGPPPLP